MRHIFKHIRQSALKGGLTILAFWFVFRGMDFKLLQTMLHQQDGYFLAIAMVFFGFQIMVGSVRWHLVLNALSEPGTALLSRLKALKIYYIGIFFTCCLPGTVGGDVVRVWLTKSEEVPLTIAIHSVIIDRIIALVALGFMILLALPLLGAIVGFNPLVIFIIVAILAMVGIVFLLNLERFIGRYKHIKLVSWLLYFLDSLRLILRRRSASIQSFLIAISTHLFYCIGVYFLAQSFHIQITLIQCIILMPPVLLATTLPISIGGWGIREAGTIFMLGFVAVAQAQALMLAIQMGLAIIIISLPASILWLLNRKHSPQPMQLKDVIGSANG